MELTKQQVEEGLRRLLVNPGGFPVQPPFDEEARPFTKLCQDWLAFDAQADAQTALLEAWKKLHRAEHSLRVTLDSVLASVREGDEIGEKMTSESLWAQASELKAAEQHLISLGEQI